MGDEFIAKMRKLDEAEQLLAACSIRGVIRDHDTHMTINRMIMDEARDQLKAKDRAA